MTLADEKSSLSDLRLEATDLEQDILEKSRQLWTGQTFTTGDDSVADMTERYFDLQEEMIEMQCETQVMIDQTQLLQSRTKRMKNYLKNKASPTKKKRALERGRSFNTSSGLSLKSLQSAPGRIAPQAA
jgi:hypothetical protein